MINIKFKNLIAFLLVITMLIPSVIFASETPAVTVRDVTVTAGGSTYVYITSQHFENVAAAEFTLYYDSDAFTVSNISVSIGDMKDYNDTVPGQISFSLGSVAGISGNVQLARVRIAAKSGIEAKKYPLTVTVGDVYNTDRQSVDISGIGGNINVNASTTVPSIAITSHGASGNYYKNDEVSVIFGTPSSNVLCGGNFEVSYDENVLEYQELVLLSPMLTGEQIYDINTNTRGNVLFSYISPTACGGGYLFEVKFKVIADSTKTTRVTLNPSELVNENRQSLVCSSTNIYKDISLIQKPIEVVLPKIWVSAPKQLASNETATVSIFADGSTNLAAGDFVVTYDADKLEIVSEPTGADGLSDIGATVVTNPNYQNGTVKFSFICSDGLSADTSLLTFDVKAKENSDFQTSISAVGSGLKDSNFKNLSFEYETAEISVTEFHGSDVDMKMVSGDIQYFYCDSCKLWHDNSGQAIKEFSHFPTSLETCFTDKFYLAGYEDSGRLVFTEFVIDGNYTFPTDATNVSYYKLMFWNDNLSPIRDYILIDIEHTHTSDVNVKMICDSTEYTYCDECCGWFNESGEQQEKFDYTPTSLTLSSETPVHIAGYTENGRLKYLETIDSMEFVFPTQADDEISYYKLLFFNFTDLMPLRDYIGIELNK